MNQVTAALVIAWGLLLAAGGCSSQGPQIKGTVTLDGRPLGNARVAFQPVTNQATAFPAHAVCDASGNFEVIPQAGGRTLSPATYGVLVSRKTNAQGSVPSEADYPQLEAAGTLVESVPAKFTSIQPGDVYAYTIEIPEGAVPALKIELKTQ